MTDQKSENTWLGKISERFLNNSLRAQRLYALSSYTQKDEPYEGDEARDDLLRAAVVFLHASFEDFLRSIASARLPLCDSDVLNDIPALGTKFSGSAVKIHLGHLANYREYTIQQYIEASVKESAAATSYNSVDDIVKLLKRLQVDKELYEVFFPSLQWLMLRRHQIVHNVDISLSEDMEPQRWTLQDLENFWGALRATREAMFQLSTHFRVSASEREAEMWRLAMARDKEIFASNWVHIKERLTRSFASAETEN